MVHGKQDAAQKEKNMKRFVNGDTQMLVVTTVIEVGVNVPNDSVMVIESSEKFGLSHGNTFTFFGVTALPHTCAEYRAGQ